MSKALTDRRSYEPTVDAVEGTIVAQIVTLIDGTGIKVPGSRRAGRALIAER
jgi:hypothetical protein